MRESLRVEYLAPGLWVDSTKGLPSCVALAGTSISSKEANLGSSYQRSYVHGRIELITRGVLKDKRFSEHPHAAEINAMLALRSRRCENLLVYAIRDF